MSREPMVISPHLRLWMLLYRVHDLVYRCEVRTFSEHGLTPEWYAALAAIELCDDPARPTDIAHSLDQRVNTISMLVDRMENAELLRRVRDLPDRREQRLTITTTGAEALKPATSAARSLTADLMSPLSDEETRTLIDLLQKVIDRAVEKLSLNGDIATSGD